MSDEELLRSAGLILPDETALKNGVPREGVTIVAILLFGKDSTIMSVLPQHKQMQSFVSSTQTGTMTEMSSSQIS